MIAQLGERQTEDLEVLGSIPGPGMLPLSGATWPLISGEQNSHMEK